MMIIKVDDRSKGAWCLSVTEVCVLLKNAWKELAEVFFTKGLFMFYQFSQTFGFLFFNLLCFKCRNIWKVFFFLHLKTTLDSVSSL